jgi:hypothetical protein
MSTFDPERIVAIDLRVRSLGFLVLEGEKRVLDWGVKSFPESANADVNQLRAKIDEFFAAYVPDTIVLRKRRGADAMLSELERVARIRRVAVHFLTRRSVNSAFPGCRNKDQIASAISEQLSDLRFLLPPKRRIWMKEDYRMRIFDAAATGIAYFAEKQKKTAVPIPPI